MWSEAYEPHGTISVFCVHRLPAFAIKPSSPSLLLNFGRSRLAVKRVVRDV